MTDTNKKENIEKLDEIEKRINIVASISKLLLQLGIAIGVISTVIYCGKIGFYPTGVSFGDGFLFIAASLAVSFTYIIIVLSLFCVGIVFSPFLRCLQTARLILRNHIKGKDNEPIQKTFTFPIIGCDKLGVVILGLLIFYFISLILWDNAELGLGLVSSSLGMSLIYGSWHSKISKQRNDSKESGEDGCCKDSEKYGGKESNGDGSEESERGKGKKLKGKSERNTKISLIIVTILIPIIVGRLQWHILNRAMTSIGVRNESAVVLLSDKYAKFLKLNDVTSDHPTTKNGAVYQATILFNGIGTNTVLEIKGVKLILPAKEVIIASKKPVANKPKQ